MAPQLRQISGPDRREIPLQSTQSTMFLGPKKLGGPIEVLDVTDPLPHRYTQIWLPQQPRYSIITCASTIHVFRNNTLLVALIPGDDPCWLLSGDQIKIGQAIYTYEEDSTAQRLKPNKGHPITLGFKKSTLGKASGPNTTLAEGHYTVDDQDVEDYHVILSPRGPEPLYAVIDLGNAPGGTLINYQPLQKDQRSPYWLKTGDKLLIGKTSGDTGTVFSYEEEISSTPGSGKPAFSLGTFIAGFIIGGLIVALIIMPGMVSQNQSTADQTLTTLCNALQGTDYQGAYNQLSNAARKRTTEQQFDSTLKQTFAQQGGLKGCTRGNTDTPKRGTVDLNFKNGKTISYSVSLVQEASTWKVDAWEPKLVVKYGQPIARLSS